MSSPSVRIGINAHLLSQRATFRAAGLSRYLIGLLTELREMAPPEEIWAYLAASEAPSELSHTPNFIPVPSSWPTSRPAIRMLWEQSTWPVSLHRDHIGLAHGPAHVLPLAWPGPSVVTIHDLAFMVDPSTFRRRSQVYLRLMVLLAARRATRVVTVSESTRRDVIRLLGVPAARVTCVYNGVEARFHPLDSEDQLESFRQAQGLKSPFILYLGTIEPRKNLVRLIDAYAELRRRGVTRWPLVLAGSVGPLGTPILDHVAEAGLSETDVRFVGFVPEAEKPLWYNAACLFVYPSQYEGFGLPVLEALACGTPVVTSDRSSLPEVVGDAAMLIDPTDRTAIADAMQQVLEDGALRDRLVSAGLKQAAPFSWRATADGTMDVYRAALAGA
ncbi:MAG: glycosyltransferase family 1 protein [Chloroflexi bacterium]|nr:glycosyltransferase family 1 protein [Chloroflexota bacterium]